MRHITYGAIIRLSTYCKVHSQIQLVSCCEGFPSHLKERFLHFNNRIISLLGTDCMDQFVYFSYIILLVYQIVSYTVTHLSFYPPYVSTLSPQSVWITAEKVDMSVKKRFSHQEVGKSSEKRGFYISLPKKMFTFHQLWNSLDHLRTTLCTYCIHYNNISSLYFICNDFVHFYYLFFQLFLFFKCYFLYYIYILWFYTLLSLRSFGNAFLYMAMFFPLFFRSFDVETSF